MPRRRLGAELRRLREAAGLNLGDAADHLECSASKISRLEEGKGVPRTRDVRDLLSLYEVHDQKVRDRLVRLAGEGRASSWWDAVSPKIPKVTGAYMDLEGEATALAGFCGFALHGLTQTPDYARTLFGSYFADQTPDEIEEMVELRIRRQEAFRQRAEPMTLRMIIDEGILHRVVGSRDIMRDQLESLIEFSQLPGVSIRVFPYSQGVNLSAQCTYTVFQFDDEIDRNVVAVELSGGDQWLEREAEVNKYLGILGALYRKCPDEAASRAIIRGIREEFL